MSGWILIISRVFAGISIFNLYKRYYGITELYPLVADLLDFYRATMHPVGSALIWVVDGMMSLAGVGSLEIDKDIASLYCLGLAIAHRAAPWIGWLSWFINEAREMALHGGSILARYTNDNRTIGQRISGTLLYLLGAALFAAANIAALLLWPGLFIASVINKLRGKESWFARSFIVQASHAVLMFGFLFLLNSMAPSLSDVPPWRKSN